MPDCCVIDRDHARIACLTEMRSQHRRLFKCSIAKITAAYDDMRAGNVLGMKPGIGRSGKPVGQIFVLRIVLSYINRRALRRGIAEKRRTQRLFLLGPAFASLLHIALLDQLFTDFTDIS
ncbi:hypothetical protein D3C78_1489770 [compost metagenome]